MKNYEYKLVEGELDVEVLNQFGKESWKLVQVLNNVLIFIRELPLI
jgi:hypothetical protein